MAALRRATRRCGEPRAAARRRSSVRRWCPCGPGHLRDDVRGVGRDGLDGRRGLLARSIPIVPSQRRGCGRSRGRPAAPARRAPLGRMEDEQLLCGRPAAVGADHSSTPPPRPLPVVPADRHDVRRVDIRPRAAVRPPCTPRLRRRVFALDVRSSPRRGRAARRPDTRAPRGRSQTIRSPMPGSRRLRDEARVLLIKLLERRATTAWPVKYTGPR